MYIYKHTHFIKVRDPSCTNLAAIVHELNSISLINQHLRQARGYYTKWSVHAYVCVCILVCCPG